jgi:hypothetical protein
VLWIGGFMSEFLKLEVDAPATLGAVVEAVTRLSTYSEAEILELASTGKLNGVFPFRPASAVAVGADSVAENELVEASAMPLSAKHHAALIQSSLPSVPKAGARPRTRRTTKRAYSDRS